MEDANLNWICLLSRLDSILIGTSDVEKKIQAIPDFTNRTKAVTAESVSVLEKSEIIFYPSATRSTFGDKICVYKQLNFVWNHAVPVPDFILNEFSIKKLWNIFFGYTGRTHLLNTGDADITNGLTLQEQNAILLDFPTHLKMGYSSLCFRLGHELLHAVGYEEEMVNTHQGPLFWYLCPKYLNYFFALYDLMTNEAEMFYKSVDSAAQASSGLLKEIKELCDIAHANGYPFSSEELQTATVYHPMAVIPMDILFF